MDEHRGKPLIGEEEAADDILGGRLQVIQRKRGYRFSLDALLLAHFAGSGKKGRILDLGTGSGIVALLLCQLRPGSHIVGIEIQPLMADMARRSLALNRISHDVEILTGDIRQIAGLVPGHTFDVAVANPPYRRLRSGRINPESERAQARHEITGTLGDFLQAAAYALKPGGRLYVIYPVRRMAELIIRMRSNRLEPKRCRIVHSGPETRGEFILAEGVAGGREEMTVAPPLYIHDQKGHYSEAMASLFNELASFPAAGGG